MNVADQVSNSALNFPHKRAVVMPSKTKDAMTYAHYTFEQLENRVNRFANALVDQGIGPGQRVLLFVKPSLDFSAMCFAIFKVGATVVLIDPGMGVKKLVNAVEDVSAHAMVAIPIVHYIRRLFPKKFKSVTKYISLGYAQGATNILKNIQKQKILFDSYMPKGQDLAAILFTSGGTGKPKGVLYTHDIFIEQTRMLKKEFQLDDRDMDIPGFPLFALFTLAMGMTSCIPLMNPARPSKANPKYLVQNIIDQGATFVAGSPAIWVKVADFCIENKITLPSVKSLVMFGAPIRIELHEKFKNLLPNGTTFTPYGATECLPVTNISGRQILGSLKEATLKGAGTCVGHVLEGVEVRIIKKVNGPIAHINLAQSLGVGEVGEVIVKSKVVTPSYFALPEKTMLAKISDEGGIWHRMGDIGYMDKDQNLWFCGRSAHVVSSGKKSFYPIPTELIYNQHPGVARSALIGFNVGGKLEPAIVIELKKDKWFFTKAKKRNMMAELIELGAHHEHTKNISHIFFNKEFPVDVRHNIKIDRQKLSDWANREKSL